jgi:hypothetical protein
MAKLKTKKFQALGVPRSTAKKWKKRGQQDDRPAGRPGRPAGEGRQPGGRSGQPVQDPERPGIRTRHTGRADLRQANWDPDTAAYLARKQAEGKSRKEALRCIKRHLTRRVWQLLRSPAAPEPNPAETVIPERPKARDTITVQAAPYTMGCVR